MHMSSKTIIDKNYIIYSSTSSSFKRACDISYMEDDHHFEWES